MASQRVATGINISNSLRAHYVFPCAGFEPFPETGGYVEHRYDDDSKDGSGKYEETATEARLRKAEHLPSNSSWIIDHSRFGTSYTVVPTFLKPMAPQRINLVIPDQLSWPANLWDRLDARDSVHVDGTRINSLGISTLLRDGLQLWSDRTPDFERQYRSQPFGSTIRLRSITESAADLEFDFLPNRALEKPDSLLSAAELSALWGFGETVMPPTISYSDLRHERQMAGEVVLVSVVTESDGEEPTMVFKSSRTSPSNIYHELKILLSLPPSKSIIGPPKYMVTIDLPSMQPQQRVCGFLMAYNPNGALDEVLIQRRLAGTLKLSQQLGWARDLTEALIHIQNSPAKFYSDLRLDQLVLSPNEDGSETAVLLDFEQSRNVYNWAPPEIYYLEWVAELGCWDFGRTDDLPEEVLQKYGAILERYLKSRGFSFPPPKRSSKYDNPPLGWYWPWLTSSPSEQEAGMVYMLGKALWCIFEGVGDADIVLGRSSPYDGQQRFPEFVRTPIALRDLIKNCTHGAREWIDGPIKVYRRNGKVFPLGKTGMNGEQEATTEETKEAIRVFWQDEMRKAEEFILARQRYDSGEAGKDDTELLHYLRRPTLKEVEAALDSFTSASL